MVSLGKNSALLERFSEVIRENEIDPGANHLYSVAALTNGAGAVVERYRYDTYGQRIVLAPDGITTRAASSYNQQVGFTGRYLDKETSLWYFRARYYSGSLGRFVSRDPLGYVDGMSLYRSYFVPGRLDPAGLASREFELKFKTSSEDQGWFNGDFLRTDVLNKKHVSGEYWVWNGTCCCQYKLEDNYELRQDVYKDERREIWWEITVTVGITATPDTLSDISTGLAVGGFLPIGGRAFDVASTVLGFLGDVNIWDMWVKNKKEEKKSKVVETRERPVKAKWTLATGEMTRGECTQMTSYECEKKASNAKANYDLSVPTTN